MTETMLHSGQPTAGRAGLPPVARGPLAAITGAAFVLLLFTSTRYAHGFDELYFVIAGRNHPAWGYFDQPPLVPALAGALDTVFPGSLLALRLPVTLSAAGAVLLTGLIARELGGRRGAQALAAGAAATSGLVTIGHWLGTYTLDPALWALLVWLLARWTRRHRDGVRADRLLVGAGVVTAVSLSTKFLVPALWAAVLVAALVCGPRELPRRPALWLGAAIAAAATAPTLLWQATHGWPYLRMSEVVAAEFPGVLGFLRDGVLSAGYLGAPALLYGLWRLVRSPELRAFRYLGVALVLVLLAFLLSHGRSYYVVSLLPLPFAAAAVELARRRLVRGVRLLVWPLTLVAAAAAVLLLPVYPRSVVERLPMNYGPFLLGSALAQAELPFTEIPTAAAAAWRALPPEQRAHTAVYSDIYPFAAALDYYGPAQGLPRTYSGHRGYRFFGAPPESATDVLFVGAQPELLRPYFTGATPVVPGLVTLYTGRNQSWARLWPQLSTQ